MKKNTLLNKAFLSLVFLLISLLGVAQSQTFTTAGANTFTVPAGVTSVTVEVWGGGGKGASVYTNSIPYAGGGGGGGAYARSTVAVTSGATVNLNVGAGSTTTAAGEDSWFINSTTILAKGGNSVADLISTGGAGGLASASIGTTKYDGGNGATGIVGSYSGGGGSSAGTGTAGNNRSAQTAGSAPVGGSAGGDGTTSNAIGTPATGFGGGGGGAKKGGGNANLNGGNGANGQVIVSWVAAPTYCAPSYSTGPKTVDQITNVTLGTLNNTSGASASPFYTFYNAVTIPNLTQSSTASVSVTFGSDATQYAAVWIDFNQNNTFEASEGVISTLNAGAFGTTIINIPIPLGAITGNTRMRIRGGDDFALTTSQACGASNSAWGETEDYIVNIVAATPPTITSLDTSSGCVGSSITINGTNLTGATVSGVTIGGTAVSSITSNSGTALVAVVGSGTTGTVSVVTPGGTATSAATFTVNPSPAQPSTISGNSTPCVGSSQTYNVTNVSGVTYNWSFPAGWTQTGGGTTSSITVTVGTSSGNISITPSNGCVGPARTLGATPTAPIANAGSALATMCVGGTSAALGGSFGGSATSAIWSDGGVGGTFTNNTGSTPNTTTWTPPPAYTGTATLTLTTAGGSCGTTTASKTQVVSTGSFATVGSAMTITGSLISTSLGGNTPSTGSGAWTKISGPSGTVTFSNSTSGTSTATVPTIGTYVFRWTVTSTCGSTYADITVTYVDANNHRNYTLFYEDFDASNGNWANSTSTNGSWLWTSSFPATIAEIGENSFWRLNNYDNYNNNSVIEIDSPIYNFTGYQNLLFNIDVRYDTETDRDGMRILYSINGGAFVQLGTNGSGVNWYNSSSVNALGSNGWSNNSATATLAFTPIGIGANRFIRATTILDDLTFKNQSNVRFRVQFKSESSNTDNGVAFDNLSVEGDAMTALALSPIAPAKINQNLSLWFKTNAGITATDGTAVTTWEDQAYDTTRADLVNKENVKALATGAPTFRDNATRNINFNPVVDFNAANKEYMNGKGGLYSQDYFVVVYPDDLTQNTMGTSGRQIPLGGKSDEQSFHEDPTGLGLGNTTARYSTSEVIAHNVGAYAPGGGAPTPGVDSYGRAFSSTTVTYNEPLIINVKTNANGTQTEIYKNGIKVDNLTGKTGDFGTGNELNFYEYKNLPFYIGTGRSGISGRAYSALNGRLSEIVAYTAPNSALNQQKIQSYLGLKYGITLHATGSANDSGVSLSTRLNDVNYIDSAANIIWNTTANTGYNYDITGIGRDDDSQLYQKQSKTVNTTDDITIGLTTIAATNNLNTNTCNNRNFLVWGNNHGTLAAQPAVVVNMSAGIAPVLTTDVNFVSIGRTWKVVETGGNVPTTKVSIPTAMLSATLTPPGDYLMFISSTTAFDPTAEYRIMRVNGSNLETDYDFDGTKYITFGFAPEKTFERCISFDGTDDYLDAGKVLNLNTSFTVSAWIKRNSTNQTILSKRDNGFTTGYDLSINSAGKAEMSWMNGTKQSITSSVVIPSGIWHNVAVSYNGTTAKLYIDGVLDVTKTMSTVPANTQSFLIAAADGVSPASFFNGGIDEVRVWNVALTDKQLRYVMNQEILSNGLATNGKIIPNTITLNDISSIPWSNLSAYYPMSTYTYTNAKDISNNNYTAALRNLTTVDLQTAPLPYESAAHGTWHTNATWKNNTVQDLPNCLSIVDGVTPINWNIIRTSHNVSSTGNKTVLGLMVNSNTITASNDTKIEVTNYLKLDGKIDLVGMSQLVQTLDSDLDVTSSGSIERDQQGQSNKYNYNYWSSPVSPINTSANNTNYTVAGIMKDGYNATPREIYWIGGYDGIAGNASTAMSIARNWLYTFDNKANDYANWNKITETTPIRVGLGFTMKGSGTLGTNYTFVGKPNNGLINSNTVLSDQLLLTGNPYPSALDAEAFINDNAGSVDRATDGTLYFWEHYSTNNTHVLKEYQGGYGVKNLVGGVAPVSAGVDGISGLGTASQGEPKRYIPVGQAFFVNGKIGSGGTIIFNNKQRAFFKETDAVNSKSMYKTRPKTSKTSKIDHWNNNSNDTVQKDNYKKVRLGFNSNNNYHRQVLLGFMNEKATSEMDYGYDGISLDEFPNDMYFLNGDNQLVIQGEGYFNEDSSYPLGVKTDVEGKVTFTIDALENFDGQQKVYIYDDEAKTYNEIQKNSFEVTLPAGENNTRFSLRFKDKSSNADKTLSVEENKNNTNEIKITHIHDSNSIVINNMISDVSVLKVTLFNINGQSIANWKIENQDQQNIKIPINAISRGVYIVKLKTSTGELSKKLIVK